MEELVHRAVQDQSDKAVQPHKPAPWTVHEAWGAEPGDALRLCFHEVRDAEGTTVASTWAAPDLESACLIAAAPDLLGACRALLAETAEWGKATDATLAAGYAAIAKATSQ